MIDSEFLPSFLKNIPLLATVLGIVISTFLINCYGVSKRKIFRLKMSSLYRKVYTFLTQRWHFDQLSNEILVLGIMRFGYRNSFQLLDKGGIEFLGPSGTAFSLHTLSRSLSIIQSGFLANYVFIIE